MPSLLGVTIDSVTHQQALERCRFWLQPGTALGPKIIFTPNPEILVYAERHQAFKAILNQADLALPDGTGVVWLTRPRLAERVTGSDLMVSLLDLAEQLGQTVGFILRRDGLSQPAEVITTLQRRWPQLSSSIIYADQQFARDAARVPTIIFVALGCPEQEQWCVNQQPNLPATTRLLLTVGGGVDFLTHQTKRAPSFFRRFGLEWFWRLLQHPKRWRRILTATIVFPWYVWTSSAKKS